MFDPPLAFAPPDRSEPATREGIDWLAHVQWRPTPTGFILYAIQPMHWMRGPHPDPAAIVRILTTDTKITARLDNALPSQGARPACAKCGGPALFAATAAGNATGITLARPRNTHWSCCAGCPDKDHPTWVSNPTAHSWAQAAQRLYSARNRHTCSVYQPPDCP